MQLMLCQLYVMQTVCAVFDTDKRPVYTGWCKKNVPNICMHYSAEWSK